MERILLYGLKHENVYFFCLVDRKNFLYGLKHENVYFSLIPKTNQENVEDVPVEVADLLHELQEIVSSCAPEGLPPMRRISHQIVLIRRASFPNKETHMMSPTKSEELNRQVQELLQKGLIRESLSQCVVPTVLAPKKGGE